MLLTNTASWTYSKRQVCQGVDFMLVFITEPLWVKAFRVRVVLGVTVQPNDGNKEGFSWMYFHRRVRFQYVGSNTHSINSYSWWIESESFCKYNKTSCFAQKYNVRSCEGCSAWGGAQVSPRCSVLWKCHTISRYICNCGVIYAHKKSMPFPVPIKKKLTDAHSTLFRSLAQNFTQIRQQMWKYRYKFTYAICKIWLSLHQFSWNWQLMSRI